jgi:hypothetical protein
MRGSNMSKYPTTGLKTAKIDNLSWLAGDWCGQKDGARIEEQWSAPAGNAMMCMFRWLQGAQVRFYEFVTIEQQAEGVVLRIKHFNPGLIGWEAKEDSIAFTLVQLDGEKAVFIKQDAPDPLWLVYRLEGNDILIACFENESGESKPSDDEFIFKRRQK